MALTGWQETVMTAEETEAAIERTVSGLKKYATFKREMYPPFWQREVQAEVSYTAGERAGYQRAMQEHEWDTNQEEDGAMNDKEFWKRCGLEIHKETWVEDHNEPDGSWYDSEGRPFEGEYDYGWPAINLDNLFRYAVPRFASVSVEFVYSDGWCIGSVLGHNNRYGEAKVANPTGNIADSYALSAQALRQAIEKVMEVEHE